MKKVTKIYRQYYENNISVIFSHDFQKGMLKTGSGKLSFLKKSRHSYKCLFGTQKTLLLTPNLKKTWPLWTRQNYLLSDTCLQNALSEIYDQAQTSYNMYKTKQKFC